MLKFSLCLVNITSPILVTTVFSLYRSHSTHPDCPLLVLIHLLLLAIIVGTIDLVSSPPHDLLLLVYFPFRHNFTYPYHNHILLVLIVLLFSWSSSTCNDYFAYPCSDRLDFASILMLLKHYQWYQKLLQGVNLKNKWNKNRRITLHMA